MGLRGSLGSADTMMLQVLHNQYLEDNLTQDIRNLRLWDLLNPMVQGSDQEKALKGYNSPYDSRAATLSLNNVLQQAVLRQEVLRPKHKIPGKDQWVQDQDVRRRNEAVDE